MVFEANKIISELLDEIENIKDKLTSQEYINIMDKLQEVYNNLEALIQANSREGREGREGREIAENRIHSNNIQNIDTLEIITEPNDIYDIYDIYDSRLPYYRERITTQRFINDSNVNLQEIETITYTSRQYNSPLEHFNNHSGRYNHNRNHSRSNDNRRSTDNSRSTDNRRLNDNNRNRNIGSHIREYDGSNIVWRNNPAYNGTIEYTNL